MAEHGATSTEREIEELRNEIRSLREEQEEQKRHPAEDKHDREPEPAAETDKDQRDTGDRNPSHRLRNIILITAAVVLVLAAIVWWFYSRQFESTDDAMVDGHISGIAARIAGTVTAAYVEENQRVKAGDTLIDLDQRDYQVALQQAQSQLRQAEAQTRAEQPNIPVTVVTNQTNISTTTSSVIAAEAAVAASERNYEAAQARIHESEANNAKAQADVERYRPLAEKDEVPREQFDQVLATAKALAATVAANRATAEAARKQVDQNREQLAQARQRAEEARQTAPEQVAIRQANVATRQASVQTARAQVEQALLNLSYCKIQTPISGIVARRAGELGQHVIPGQQVVLVAQIDDVWVTANYKETQIRRMREGQGVRIHVDALATDFDGYVEAMPAASGAITSLLPPENATGNFVKVVQRLPVRIRFKKDQPGLDLLRPGMSVEPKTRVL